MNETPPPLPTEVAGREPKIPATGLVGRYRDDYLGEAVVSVEGQQLSLALLGRKVALSHWRDDQYSAHWSDALLQGVLATATFESGGTGGAERLRLGRWVLQRQP